MKRLSTDEHIINIKQEICELRRKRLLINGLIKEKISKLKDYNRSKMTRRQLDNLVRREKSVLRLK